MSTVFEHPPLPQEIFDNIIAYFQNDHRSLQTCALVSPLWLSSARSHIFHCIFLHPPSTRGGGSSAFFFARTRPASSCQRLLDILAQSQAGYLGPIAPHIRELHVLEGMISREWLAQEPALPHLLRKLTNLRRFEISRSASMRIPWGKLPLSLRSVVQEQVMASSALTQLKLGSLLLDKVDNLKTMLQVCRFLRVLEVNHLSFEDEGVQCLQNGEGDEVIPLDTLTIGPRTSTTLIRYLLHPLSTVSVATLRHLTLSISGNFADFARLLHASSFVQSLELVLMNDLDLKEYWKIPPSQQFDLVQVPSLRKLKVYIDVLQKGDDPLPWLSAMLYTGINRNHPSRSNAIESVWIVYSLYLPAPYMDRSINTAIFDAWKEVDAILSGNNADIDEELACAYDNLRSVKLEFMLENPIGFGVAPRFLKDVVLDSPGLAKRALLEINAFDTSK